MGRAGIAVLLLLASASGAGGAVSRSGAAEQAAIAECMAAMPAGVQVAVALIAGDEIRFLGVERTAAGVRPVENRSTPFQIASITKVFTATLLAQEVVGGRLRLDDAVADRSPFRLRARGRDGVAMTLGQLASHTSGIAHHQPPGLIPHAWLHLHLDTPWRDYDRERFADYCARELRLASTPGRAYRYSNMGVSLLGHVLSHASGKPYETLLRERIFLPLGMTGSTTEWARVRGRVVPGLTAAGRPLPNQDMVALAPCGGLYSTAEDLARFARAQIERSDPGVALSQEPVFTIAEGERVALGWHVYDWEKGWCTLNHNGAIGGYTATVHVDPARGCAAIVLANVRDEKGRGESVRALGRKLLSLTEESVASRRR